MNKAFWEIKSANIRHLNIGILQTKNYVKATQSIYLLIYNNTVSKTNPILTM